jgi:hypothetical protein
VVNQLATTGSQQNVTYDPKEAPNATDRKIRRDNTAPPSRRRGQ